MRRFKQKARAVFVLVVASLCLYPALAAAQCDPGVQSCSNNYQVDQTFFGSGGNLEACSTQYCSKQTLGELAVGETSSTLFRAYAGFNTTDEPYIEMAVAFSDIDLGVLDTDAPRVGVGTFYIRAWQASGYVVRSESDPPTNVRSGYQFNTPSTPFAPSAGTEQFGINLIKNVNLVNNLCPTGCDVGADPVQAPDNTFSFGYVESGYDTPGQFKHAKGDIIARSDTSSSRTVYSITYLFNISDTTPSGLYRFTHNLVAIGTY